MDSGLGDWDCRRQGVMVGRFIDGTGVVNTFPLRLFCALVVSTMGKQLAQKKYHFSEDLLQMWLIRPCRAMCPLRRYVYRCH